MRILAGRGRVHERDRTAGRRNHLERARIVRESGHIVDDMRARRQCGLHDGRLARVGRDDDAALREALDDGHDAGDLVAFPDRLRAGPRGLAADIDDGDAGDLHGEARIGRLVRIADQLATVREAVRRHVEDAHDLWAIEAQHPFAQLQRGARGREAGEQGRGALRLRLGQARAPVGEGRDRQLRLAPRAIRADP